MWGYVKTSNTKFPDPFQKENNNFQTWNALTNVAFLASAVIVSFLQPDTVFSQDERILYSVLLFFVGLTSFMFHATAPGFWGQLDLLSVVWLFEFYLAKNIAILASVPELFYQVFGPLAGIALLFSSTKLLNTWSALGLGLGALVTFFVVQHAKLAVWPLAVAGTLITFATVSWVLNYSGKGVWLHGVFHLLMAAAALAGWFFYALP